MTKRKPSKPRTAAQREKERREAEERAVAIAGRRAERRELESRGITVYVDPKDQTITGRVRLNCFAMLLTADSPERRAIDWLETVIRTSQGENTPERRPDHIRASTEGAPGQNLTADMIAAGAVLEAVEGAMAPCDVRILFALLKPDAALLTRWRDVVQQATRETNPQAQGARVRGAATSLAHVRTIVDQLVWARREQRRLAA